MKLKNWILSLLMLATSVGAFAQNGQNGQKAEPPYKRTTHFTGFVPDTGRQHGIYHR